MPAQTKNRSSRFQAPLYAAAGAGDLVYQRLRKVELDRVTEFAQAAQHRAAEVYRDLVARGERVVTRRETVKTAPSAVESTPAAVDEPRPIKRTRPVDDK
jgi:hypothetical protein